ncbi:MAG: hypothetical protein ACK53Q_06350 [Dolichospermum sp.]|jgi:cellulose synthase/poly-beta-1,6-N-acetylglucosamine synthase-like glycosyltransferase
MIEIEEFETEVESVEPTFLQQLTATLKCWRWGAMHSPSFSDFYIGLNQSPIELYLLANHRFSTIAMTFYRHIWFMTCIPFSAINHYQESTKSDTSLIWK